MMNTARRGCLLAVAMLVMAACDASQPTTAVTPARAVTPVAPFVVSSPVPNLSRAFAGSVASQGVAPTVVYVSLPPGEFPNGEVATITVERTGVSTRVSLENGGFDPVELMAAVGDTITISVRITGASEEVVRRFPVPAKAPPIIVRTDPPPHKRDVPLNARVIVVFSAPIDASSLNDSTVQVWRDTALVSGELSFTNTTHTAAQFAPAASLRGETDYELVVTTGIRDVSGSALNSPIRVAFTTQVAPVASVAVSPISSSLLVGSTVPLTATLKDAEGNVLGGHTVVWSTDSPGVATVSSNGVVTGRASGSAIIQATSEGVSGAALMTVADLPVQLVRISGDGQLRAAATTLPRPIVVALRHTDGSAVAGASVQFVVTSGDGAILSPFVTTDANGVAATSWLLGTPGEQRAEARYSGSDPVAFQATAVAISVSLTGPLTDERFVAGENVSARATVLGYAALADSVVWRAGGVELGRGLQLNTTAVPVGSQQLTVDVLGAKSNTPIRVFRDLWDLYQAPLSQGEINRILADFTFTFTSGTGTDENWAAYQYAFDQSSVAPSRVVAIAKLDVLRHQRFTAAPTFTGGRASVYDWVRSVVSVIELRLDCGNASGGGGKVSLPLLFSVWDGRMSTSCKVPIADHALFRYTASLYLLVHEARHSEPGDPGHVTCSNGIPGDAFFENGGGYAYSALYAAWVYKYGQFDPTVVKSVSGRDGEDARSIALVLLGRICTTPTHSNPLVQQLLTELLGR
jgi:hypothetical protein